jgi:hypothetical protein
MSGTTDRPQVAYPSPPPSWHQITSVPASECALKKLQRALTTFKGQSASFSRPSSGWGFPPSVPAGPSQQLCRGFRAPAFCMDHRVHG